MVTTIQTALSLDQFLAMPETKPASEYANGIVAQKPMPQGEHSHIQSCLCREIDQFAADRKIVLALTELRCTFGGRSLKAANFSDLSETFNGYISKVIGSDTLNCL